MTRTRLFILALPLALVACSSLDERGTIAQLRNRQIEIKEEKIVGGLEKAMAGYQQFLQETPDSALAPEAIRRLADLKVEKEYGLITDQNEPASRAPAALPAPQTARPAAITRTEPPPASSAGESEADFERRTIGAEAVAASADLERAGALEAIELYRKLLDEYPLYDRNDQVLYQMSRAYEELGRIEEAMEVMDRLVRNFPQSRYIDEVQFRRAEYFFTRRKYLDAEDAYKAIVVSGVASSFYQLALYKLGWTFYKQELYEEGLDKFVALLDYKVSVGYDFEQTEDEPERQRMEDTFHVISLSFSYLGGADALVDYFVRQGRRKYEDRIYGNLGEYYFDKRRYNDATATYSAFVSRKPFHKMSPHFHMRVIEINTAGGFPTLVIDSKKEFATRYGLKAEYWQHFESGDYPEVLDYLKTNLKDLANHYHALYQSPKQGEEKPSNFAEALRWYREYLVSFPTEVESPGINYQLADLLLENRSFAEAAVEYEKTAYVYPRHEKSATAGYAAVFARREQLAGVPADKQEPVKRAVVASSLQFADTFPEHEKASIVLGAAADDLYAMQDYEPALAAAGKLIATFPETDRNVLCAAWLVVGHASYELKQYSEAEQAYVKVLAMLPPDAKARENLVDNLAAAIYKQGEAANAAEDYRLAAEHFLRVGRMAPTSRIRPTAEFDAATALIRFKDWGAAATVLVGFRNSFLDHELQPEVTKKIAFVYREDGKSAQAAEEYERIETESDDQEVRREALQIAAELYVEAGRKDRALEVYRRYVASFPQPVELNLETRNKIAAFLKEDEDQAGYLEQLRQIVAIDAAAGDGRTERTRYIAGNAALVLAEQSFDRFAAVKLVKPFKVNLRKKQKLMKVATREFGNLLDYEVGEVTAAATFYLGEIYAHFSKALMESERPEGLSPVELEEYELAIEEQAYPFEEKAISVHESNLELIPLGIYNVWVDRSLQKLARFVPARYARPEEESDILTSLDSYRFEIHRPLPSNLPLPDEQTSAAVAAAVEPELVAEPEPGKDRVQEKPELAAKPLPTEESARSAAGQVAQDGGGDWTSADAGGR